MQPQQAHKTTEDNSGSSVKETRGNQRTKHHQPWPPTMTYKHVPHTPVWPACRWHARHMPCCHSCNAQPLAYNHGTVNACRTHSASAAPIPQSTLTQYNLCSKDTYSPAMQPQYAHQHKLLVAAKRLSCWDAPCGPPVQTDFTAT